MKTLTKTVIGLILLTSLFNQFVLAATLTRYSRDWLEDESYKPEVFYKKGANTYYGTLTVPVVSTDNDVIAGISLMNITIIGGTKINNATLYLRSQLNPTNGTDSIPITIYGYRGDLNTGIIDPYGATPTTQHFTNADLQNFTGLDYYAFDVTDIVAEITSRYYWDEGDSLGFYIFGASGDLTRYFQSNIGVTGRPYLEITYGESSGSPGSGNLIEEYGGYKIYNTSDGDYYLIKHYTSATNQKIFVFDTNFTYVSNFTINSISQGDLYGGHWAIWNNTLYITTTHNTNQDAWIHKVTNFTGTPVWDSTLLDGSGTKQWCSLTLDRKNAILHIFFSDAGSPKHTRYFLNNDTYSAIETITTFSYGTGWTNGIVDTEGNLYITMLGGKVGSNQNLWFKQLYYANNSWSNEYQLTSGNDLYAQIHLNNNHLVITYYQSGTTIRAFYKETTDPYDSWNGYETCSSATPSSVYFAVFSNDVLYVGYSENPVSDYLYYVSWNNYPFNESWISYNEANFSSNDIYGSPVLTPGGSVRHLVFIHDIDDLEEYETGFFSTSHAVGEWNNIIYDPWTTRVLTASNNMFGPSTYYVTYPNGTIVNGEVPCLATATTIEEIEACLDNYPLPSEGGGDPNDPDAYPDPTGGYLGRSQLRFYFFIIGWVMFWGPWFMIGLMRPGEKLAYWMIAVFLSFAGFGLLKAIPYI